MSLTVTGDVAIEMTQKAEKEEKTSCTVVIAQDAIEKAKETVLDVKDKKIKKANKENLVYQPVARRIAALVLVSSIAAAGVDVILPKTSSYLDTTIHALMALVFLAAYEKSAKNFLKSIPNVNYRIGTVAFMMGSALAADISLAKLTYQDTTSIKTYGFTGLVTLVFLKYLALSFAGYQKPIKD